MKPHALHKRGVFWLGVLAGLVTSGIILGGLAYWVMMSGFSWQKLEELRFYSDVVELAAECCVGVTADIHDHKALLNTIHGIRLSHAELE